MTVSEKRQQRLETAVEQLRTAESSLEELQDKIKEKVEEFTKNLLTELKEDIDAINGHIESGQNIVADVRGDIEEARDNLEEKFSGTERYQTLSDAADAMDIDSLSLLDLDGQELEDWLEKVDDKKDEVSTAADSIEGVEL